MSKLGKRNTRDAARHRARYAPRGHATDNRPAVVQEDRGRVRWLVRRQVTAK